jgi:maleylacetoacetate isomerase
MLKLYGYFRSSASYRIRIVLNMKGLAYEQSPIHLRRGEQFDPAYRALNPLARVPTLIDGEHVLTQSLAIAEYVDERWPEPPLLPREPADRARVRALAQSVACDIHPIQNTSVLAHIETVHGFDEGAKTRWAQHWIASGFAAIETMLARDPATATYCHGERPTVADAFLIPQVANARRFGLDLTPYPTIVRIDAACRALTPFAAAAPERQPDAA